ncbi:MAG: hypothetical protein L6R35_001868 [Caloplaca aegaea]|nr:MAG: hypothetical protein L6R35_001868 [Caloplaca aegaea]
MEHRCEFDSRKPEVRSSSGFTRHEVTTGHSLEKIGDRNQLKRFIACDLGVEWVTQKPMNASVEAIVGAAYEDGGMEVGKKVVEILEAKEAASAFEQDASVYPPLEDRPTKETICLFDVDGTLTPARGDASPQVLQLLSALRHKCAIGFVGGSDLIKQQEQLGTPEIPVTSLFDFCFSENGLTAFRLGQQLAGQSFIGWLGEDKYKQLVNFCLRYISEIDCPVKRGTFVEFRNGMINISPIGRNCSLRERNDFEAYDKTHQIREKFVAALKEKFSDLGLTFSIGGQISFDVFPTGWDKTHCLQHIEREKKISGVDYKTIHFFGDKTSKGGNDYEIYEDERTVGHSVRNPEDTMKELKKMFDL